MRVKLPDGVSADALLPVAEAHGVVFLPARAAATRRSLAATRGCASRWRSAILVEGAKRLGAATRELLAAANK